MATITAIFTTHDESRIKYLLDAAESIDKQPHDIEKIVVVEDDELVPFVEDSFNQTICDPIINSLSGARNAGARSATADIYAFLDDDVVVNRGWSTAILAAYENHDAIAAGGPAYPDWEKRPRWLPQRWDWLVGCGPYYGELMEARNSYGCNISFRADVFDALSGFDVSYGKSDDLNQAEETELCRRMIDEYDRGLNFRPDAGVTHKVFDEQLRVRYLIRRAYEQGRAKARLGLDDEETGFVWEVISDIKNQSIVNTISSFTYLAATGAGYLYG